MAVGSAIITAGASLYGSKRNRDEQRRATAQANERADAQTQRALVNLQPGYEQAMQSQQRGYEQAMQSERGGFGQANRINQEALERAMMMRGSTFMPQMQAYERGNVAAQEANLAALPAMRAAILGGRMPAPMQARSLPINQTALEGLMNPTAQQFQQRPARQSGQNLAGMGMQGGRMGQKVLGSMGMGRRGMGMNQPMNQPMNNRPMTEEEYMQQAMYEQRPTMQFERSRYEMP
jgi:hypothetical protein